MAPNTFPTSLCYCASLHDDALLQTEIQALSTRVAPSAGGGEKEATKDKTGQALMDALHKVSNLTLTANGAVANKSSLDACLDLDYTLGPFLLTAERSFDLLEKAYAQDPLVTLKIIFSCRSIHQGKGARSNFYLAFCWLLWKHPQTALANLHLVTDGTIAVTVAKKEQSAATADEWTVVNEEGETLEKTRTLRKSHGYWKDLLNLIKIYALGEHRGALGKDLALPGYIALNWPRTARQPKAQRREKERERTAYHKALGETKGDKVAEEALRAERAKQVKAYEDNLVAQAQEKRAQHRVERHAHVCHLLTTDPTYRALHLKVARLFADQLSRDKAQLETNEKLGLQHKGRHAVAEGISLAAKWAPTLGGSHDKFTLIATSIAELLFPPADEEERQDGEARRQYLHHVRERYRKEYLIPLRGALDITERRMSERRWSTIDFSHVPSKCMQINATAFATHAEKEFTQYLKAVMEGKRTTTGGTLDPHELVKRAYEVIKKCDGEPATTTNKMLAIQRDLVNAQWNTLVKTLRDGEHGDGSVAAMADSLAVCDTSGSMHSDYGGDVEPIWPAMGLALLLSELGRPPFDHTIISFTDEATVVEIPRTTLTEQVSKLGHAPWGYSTNFEAVFIDLLLPLAKKHNLRQEDMVKRLFVLSDMHFNAGTETEAFETLWESIERRYHEAGYTPPHIVWWNLAQGGSPMPVTKDTKNCSMVSGFSASMLKSFLAGAPVESEPVEEEAGEQATGEQAAGDNSNGPIEMMLQRLEHPSFQGVVVIEETTDTPRWHNVNNYPVDIRRGQPM